MKNILYILIATIVAAACGGNGRKAQLELADSLIAKDMDDSAQAIINGIDANDIRSRETKAYYNLLKAELVFRSGIVTPNDSIINLCIAYYENSDDKHKLAQAYYFKGRMLHKRNKQSDAIMALKKAEQAAKHTDDNWLKARIYNNLASFNTLLSESRYALEYGKEAVRYANAYGNAQTLSDAYRQMSAIYTNLDMEDSSIVYAKKCEPLIKQIKNEKTKTLIHGSLAAMYLKTGNLYKAKQHALIVAQKDTSHSTYYILSCIYRKEGDTAKADSLRAKALHSADDHYRLMILTDMWNEKKAEGKYREATELAEKITALRDTLANKERTDSIREKQTGSDIIAAASKKIAKQRSNTSLVLAIAIAMTIILGCAAHQINRKRKKAQAETEKANTGKKELTSINANLTEMVKCLEAEAQDSKTTAEKMAKAYSELERQLKQEEDRHNKELHKAAKEHLQDMKECLEMFRHVLTENGSITEWSKDKIAKFVSCWGALNSDEAETLNLKYAKLTEWNKMILILKLSGKTTKEICAITGMTEHALTQALYRIKQKEKHESKQPPQRHRKDDTMPTGQTSV